MAEPDRAATAGRRAFGPVVLVGLGSAGLTAVAGDRAWVTVDTTRFDGMSALTQSLGEDPAQMPLATALALVLLAAWGVLLVTRGRVRRVVAVLVLLAALGVVATVLVGARTVPADLRIESERTGTAQAETSYTGWFSAAALGSVLATLAAGAAVRWVVEWPQLGRRYDAPGAAHPPASQEPLSELELWRAFDEGRDPTA